MREALIEALEYAAARLQTAAAEFRRGDADAGKREIAQATQSLDQVQKELEA